MENSVKDNIDEKVEQKDAQENIQMEHTEESKNSDDAKEKNKFFKKKDKKKDEELEKANAKIKELENALLKSKADYINYRKRLDEEQSRIFKYSNEDVIKSILPTVDNFERAIAMDDDNLEDELSKFLAGFKMIYANLVEVLKRYDVKEIDGYNKPFDPTYHQAVLTEHRDGVEPDMVIEVLQKGYILKDKVIRPAMVKVSI